MAGSLEGNKIAGAILTAGIIGVGSAVLSGIIYHPHELEEPVYVVAPAEGEATAEAGGDAAAEGEEQPIGPLLAAASVEEGEKAAKKCAACHSFEQGGANKVGPGLWGVVNRPIASHEGFSYSEALSGKSGEVWDYEHLNAFLTNPKSYAPGTKMSFAGIKKPEERAAVIAYLRSLADQPAPLPEG
jgi:cytochrome c